MKYSVDRRGFLKLGVLASAASIFPGQGLTVLPRRLLQERSLSFYNTHTGESLQTVYWAGGAYVPGALDGINYILRDHRADEIKPIDPRLLDLLYRIRESLLAVEPFHLISGYRSRATNDYLRRCGRGVARNSLHVYGQAADVRLPGCELAVLRQAATDLRGGGVGYYPHPDFVHIDVGRVRTW